MKSTVKSPMLSTELGSILDYCRVTRNIEVLAITWEKRLCFFYFAKLFYIPLNDGTIKNSPVSQNHAVCSWLSLPIKCFLSMGYQTLQVNYLTRIEPLPGNLKPRNLLGMDSGPSPTAFPVTEPMSTLRVEVFLLLYYLWLKWYSCKGNHH